MIVGIEKYRSILKSSLLANWTEAESEAFLKDVRIFSGERGQRVGREDSPQFLYFLLEGEASLRLKTGAEVGRLEPGQSFELKTMLNAHKTWQYDWILEANSTLMAIAWPAFEVSLKKKSELYRYLLRVSQSVALQRLKRDLNGLGLSREAVIEIISMLHLESSEIIFSDWTRKIFFTVQTGEIVASVQYNDQKYKVAYHQAGDTSLVDLKKSKLTYESKDSTTAWVLFDSEWKQLRCLTEFLRFLEVFTYQQEEATEFYQAEPTRFLNIQESSSGPKVTVPSGKSSIYSMESRRLWWWRSIFRPKVIASRDEGRNSVAVLTTLGSFYGFELGAERVSYKIQGLAANQSFEALNLSAKSLGFETKLRSYESLPKNASYWPAVILLESGFKILFARNGESAILGDPETGQVSKVDVRSIEAHQIDKRYLILAPGKHLKNRPDPQVPFYNYLKIVFSKPYLILLLFVAGMLGYLFEISGPVLNQYLFDGVIAEKNSKLFYPTVGGILLFSLLGAYTENFSQRIVTDLSTKYSIRLKSLFMDRLMRIPANYVRQIGASGILTRIQDIDAVGSFFARSFLHSFLSLFLMVASLSVLWLYHYKLVYLILILIPIEGLVVRTFKNRLEDNKFELNQLKSNENRMLVEHFTSNEGMKALKGQLTARWRWDVNAVLEMFNMKKSGQLNASFQILHFFVGEMAKILTFLAAVRFYLQGQMSLGQVVGTSMLVPKVTQPLQEMISTYYQYFSVRPILARMNDIIYAPVEPIDLNEKKPGLEIPFQGNIRFENVSFSYDSAREKTLNGVNFSIKAGEKVAFIGPSGSGKSSIASLLSDLTQVDTGEIYIDDKEIGSYNLGALRNSIGVVEQDGMLFGGTIRENIGWGESQHEIDRIQVAAKQAEIEDEILAKPGGFSAMIAAGGVGVSEGQKQRLLIARMLYKNPSILVLDEATCHLDPIAEEKVISRILKLYKERTVIFFTQRIHLTMKADRIFYIEEGRVVESGTHDELIKRRQKYFEFFILHLSLG